MSASAASQGLIDNSGGDETTSWEEFKEWLLPSVTFAASDKPKSDLRYGRILVCIFYAVLAGVFIYTVGRLCNSGRIELFSNLYKVDFVEAPSLAFCPFNPHDSIQWPSGASPAVIAKKFELTGDHSLAATLHNCSFDRHCGCVDMNAYRLSDSARETHPAGGNEAMVFRESIEIRTGLKDPSPDHVLKVGIYDSYDKAPDWFYVNQGSTFIGQLELIIWTVVDISAEGLVKTLKGDLRAMVKNRHIFRYTSQQVGTSRHDETAIRYEMKTFFVEETMSSHRAFSLYTVGVLIALFALRYVVVDAFFVAIMPEHDPVKKNKPVLRELSSTSNWLRSFCCCCLDDSEASERGPLVEGKAAEA